MEKCLRCKAKEAIFVCMLCDSFKFLCSRCDTYVHSLPSKRGHKRNSLVKENEECTCNIQNNNNEHSNLNEQIIDQRLSNEVINHSGNVDFQFNVSPINNNVKSVNFTSMDDKMLQMLNKQENIQNETERKIEQIKAMPIQESKDHSDSYTYSPSYRSNILMYSNYSRDYLNEIKVH